MCALGDVWIGAPLSGIAGRRVFGRGLADQAAAQETGVALFYDQACGLVEGGVDLLVVETCQDSLQAKAALAGIRRYFADAKRTLPVIVSVTVEQAGTMLLGTEIAAALTALEPVRPDLIGMNCATGPKEMSESVRHLCRHSPVPVFVMPNAGIPENVGGLAHYHLTPDELVRYLRHFVTDLGFSAVGGCCGTTPLHIRALSESVGALPPPVRLLQLANAMSVPLLIRSRRLAPAAIKSPSQPRACHPALRGYGSRPGGSIPPGKAAFLRNGPPSR